MQILGFVEAKGELGNSTVAIYNCNDKGLYTKTFEDPEVPDLGFWLVRS